MKEDKDLDQIFRLSGFYLGNHSQHEIMSFATVEVARVIYGTSRNGSEEWMNSLKDHDDTQL